MDKEGKNCLKYIFLFRVVKKFIDNPSSENMERVKLVVNRIEGKKDDIYGGYTD